MRGFGDFWQHCLVAEGSLDVAVDAYQRASDLAPRVPTYRINLASALCRSDRGTEASSHLDRAISLDPGLRAVLPSFREFEGKAQGRFPEQVADAKARVAAIEQLIIDIGAIEFIHSQIIALKEQGCAILVVSVELDEILALSDRIMVMNAGRVVGTIPREGATRQSIGLMMAGEAA